MKRGAKKGSVHTGSHNARLLDMRVGECRWYETTRHTYSNLMRTVNAPPSRRPRALKRRKFVARFYTAVGVGRVGDIRYVIRLERVK